jgi:polyferredoxin
MTAVPRTDPAKRRTAKWTRWGLLLTVLAASTILGLLHANRSGTFWPVGVDALCPFGGLESLNSLILNGAYLKKVEFGSLALLIASVILVAVFGRTFCGRICPLGTLQEVFQRLWKRFVPEHGPVPVWHTTTSHLPNF